MTAASSKPAPYDAMLSSKTALAREKPCSPVSATRRCSSSTAWRRTSRRSIAGKSRVVQPRRIRQRPRCCQHCQRGAAHWQTRSRKNSARLDQRQHRHRLCHARRRSRISGHLVRAGKCFSRAKADSTGLWRKYHLHRSRGRVRWSDQDCAPTGRTPSRSLFLC